MASDNIELPVIWGAVYLIIFIGIQLLQTALRYGRKRGKKYVDSKKGNQFYYEAPRRLLDPNVIWIKVPFFIMLFATIGIAEAHLRINIGATDADLFSFAAMGVFFIYLIMILTIRVDREQVYFSIMMGGLLALTVAYILASIYFTGLLPEEVLTTIINTIKIR